MGPEQGMRRWLLTPDADARAAAVPCEAGPASTLPSFEPSPSSSSQCASAGRGSHGSKVLQRAADSWRLRQAGRRRVQPAAGLMLVLLLLPSMGAAVGRSAARIGPPPCPAELPPVPPATPPVLPPADRHLPFRSSDAGHLGLVRGGGKGAAGSAIAALHMCGARPPLRNRDQVGTFDAPAPAAPRPSRWRRVAPEVLLGGHSCTAAVDIYSFGGAKGGRGAEGLAR